MADYNSRGNRQKQDRLSLLAQRIENQNAYQQQGLALREQQIEMTQEERAFQHEIAKTQQLKTIADTQAAVYKQKREQETFAQVIQARARAAKLDPRSVNYFQQVQQLRAELPLAAGDADFGAELKFNDAVHQKAMDAHDAFRARVGEVPVDKDGRPNYELARQMKERKDAATFSQAAAAVGDGAKLTFSTDGKLQVSGPVAQSNEDMLLAASKKGAPQALITLLRNANDPAKTQRDLAAWTGSKVTTADELKSLTEEYKREATKLFAETKLAGGMPVDAAGQAKLLQPLEAINAKIAAYHARVTAPEAPVVPVDAPTQPAEPSDPFDSDLNPAETPK